MKYAVSKVVNGTFFIQAEGFNSVKEAKTSFFDTCKTLNNAPDVVTASVKIIDEEQNCCGGYEEHINNVVTA